MKKKINFENFESAIFIKYGSLSSMILPQNLVFCFILGIITQEMNLKFQSKLLNRLDV